jgi:chemotaxis protein MotA
VGQGIASAFVATIYGVGSANLLFLPAAAKIRLRARTESERRELMLEGVIGLAEGLNPKLIGGKLEAYLRGPATQARARNPKVLPAAARAEAS